MPIRQYLGTWDTASFDEVINYMNGISHCSLSSLNDVLLLLKG